MFAGFDTTNSIFSFIILFKIMFSFKITTVFITPFTYSYHYISLLVISRYYCNPRPI